MSAHFCAQLLDKKRRSKHEDYIVECGWASSLLCQRVYIFVIKEDAKVYCFQETKGLFERVPMHIEG